MEFYETIDDIEEILVSVAERVTSDDKFEALGKALGFTPIQIDHFMGSGKTSHDPDRTESRGQCSIQPPVFSRSQSYDPCTSRSHVMCRSLSYDPSMCQSPDLSLMQSHDPTRRQSHDSRIAKGAKALNMLTTWTQRMTIGHRVSALRTALVKAGLSGIADRYAYTNLPQQFSKQRSLTPEEVRRYRDELKRQYRLEYDEISTSPYHRKKLEQVYQNLAFIRKGLQGNKTPLAYEGFIKLLTDDTERERILLLGEAGVGKSTLLAKIAHDWATGKCLEDIDLLFVIRMGSMKVCQHFGDYAKKDVYDVINSDGACVDEFIRTHQQKVLIFFDAMDECEINWYDDREWALYMILNGQKFKRAKVVLTCRSWNHDNLTSYDKFYLRYIIINVDGIKEGGVQDYVRGFFADAPESAERLIEILENDCAVEVVEQYMKYPLFCSMICHIWKDGSRHVASKKLQTISQVIQEMVYSLIEQYTSKLPGEAAKEFKAKCDDCFRKLGQVALNGMLRCQWTFRDIEFPECLDAVEMACLIGVVYTWTRVGPIEFRRREGRRSITDVRFPHRLLQEYVASEYLASVYQEDIAEFKKLLKEKIFEGKRGCKVYKKLLYLLVAHNVEIGTAVMEMLCEHETDEQLIMDVAFECQDRQVITPAIEFMKRTSSISIQANTMFRHTWNGYLDTWEALGLQIMEERSSCSPVISLDERGLSFFAAGVGLFSLPSLGSLTLVDVEVDDPFYEGMAAVAAFSQIETLTHSQGLPLGSAASAHFARGLFSMPKLRSLELDRVHLDPKFFSAMSKTAASSQLETFLQISDQILGPVASRNYANGLFSLPSLMSLELDGLELDDEFFYVLTSLSSKSKLESVCLAQCSVSHGVVGNLQSLPHLKSLNLDCVTCRDPGEAVSETDALSTPSPLAELRVDSDAMPALWLMGLPASTPNIQRLVISFDEDITPHVVTMACSAFPHLPELNIEGDCDPRPGIADAMSFCEAVCTSCPVLTTLSIKDVQIGDKMATEIIKGLKKLPSLKNILLLNCDTTPDLNDLCKEMESLKLDVTHGQPQ